jgi:hypothetical protein
VLHAWRRESLRGDGRCVAAGTLLLTDNSRAGDTETGLVAYFKLDEGQDSTFYDSAPYGSVSDIGVVHNLNGTAGTHWSWVGGKFGESLYFDPDYGLPTTNQDDIFSYAEITKPSADLDNIIAAGESFSIALWLKLGVGGNDGCTGQLIWKSFNCLDYVYGNYRFQVWQKFDDGGTIDGVVLDGSAKNPDQWYHVAYVADNSTSVITMYVDGAVETVTNYAAGVLVVEYPSDPWLLASLADQNSSWASHVTMDEIRFYNRALSASDAAAVYNYSPPQDIVVSVAATDDTATEGTPATDTAEFTFTASPAPAADLTVNFTVAGDATSGSDYTSIGTTVVIPPAGSVALTVTPIDDTDYGEAAETVSVTLATGAGYILAASPGDTAEVTIYDNDSPPPDAPILSIPIDGANLQIDVDTSFMWGSVPGALTYDLRIYSDASATVLVHEQTGLAGTSYTLPANTLDTEQVYYWKVAAVNASGSTDSTVGDFNGVNDNPTILSTSPSDGSSAVDVGTTIRVNFSEPIDFAGISAGWVVVDGGSISGTVTQSGSSGVVFTPDAKLAYDTTYSVVVSTSIQDESGKSLDVTNGRHLFDFTTQKELAGLAVGEGCVPGAGAGSSVLALLLGLAAEVLRRRERLVS